MKLLHLKYPYPRVMERHKTTVGGRQSASPSKTVRRCGCGLIACCDLLYYLRTIENWEHGTEQEAVCGVSIPIEEYQARLSALQKRYFPLCYPFGTTGVQLAFGLNRIFRKQKLPLRARWCCTERQFWSRMQAQLEQNLPVIVSVGPNFPLFWQKHRLPLCQKAADGVYICTDSAVSHFFTVIGMDDLWMRVVSWGRLYEISREAYSDFVNKHSCWLFSNLIELQKKEHRR